MALPGLIAAAIEPAFGLLADSGRRRLIVVAGGLAFAAGLGITALASGFAWLLVGFIVMTVLTIALACVPLIPGLRDIPRWLPIHRLIWRNYYAPHKAA